MKLICLTFLLLVLVDTVLPAQYFGEATVRKGKCYYSKGRIYLAPGEVKDIKPGCKEMVCVKRREKLFLEINGCYAVEKHCRLPGNKNLPYPECCAKNKCLIED